MDRERRDEIGSRIGKWLDVAFRASRLGYTYVARANDLPAQARADSMFWANEVLLPEANPYTEARRARHGFHVATADTPDLLRHEYTAVGLAIILVEGRNFGLLKVERRCLDVLSLPRKARARAIDDVAARILRPDAGRPPIFPFDAPVEEGSRTSTSPEIDPLLMASSREREEAGICCGCVYFLYYKRVSQLAGFLSPTQWFEDEFRSGSPPRRRRA